MSITKIAKMTTEITADYQKLSDLNVAFYNQDINTSILQFNVTRNNAPVPLGKVNVDGYIVLLAADGSRIQDAVKIVDELKGVIEYTIPKEFLKHTGTAVGQIYIAVKGKDDTAVMRQFSFDIEKDLLTGFSAEIKLEYIKTFYDLERIIYGRVQAIDEAIANGEDYVTVMQKAVDKGKQDIQAVATKATADVNKAATDATKKITDTSNAAVTTVNVKGDEVLKKIADGDVVQKKDYYPLVSGAGTRTKLADGTDLLTLKTGYYEVAQCKNSPFAETEASWKNIDVIDGGAGRKMLRLTVSNRGDTFYKTLHTNSTGGRDWWQAANTSDLQPLVKSSEAELWQKQKIWNDDGSTITITNYDLLNTTDIANFDGYSNTAINMPDGVHKAGYIKRKYRSGYIEVTYSPYNLNTVYRNSYNSETKVWTGWEKLVTASELAALESKVNTSEVNTSKPVTLWSGSANGVSSTPYALSRAINTSRKIRVTYDFSGGSGHVAVFDPSIAKTLSIQEFNLVNSDPASGGFYELELDITTLNSFKISTDSLKDFNGTATIAKNAYTVRKLEEFD